MCLHIHTGGETEVQAGDEVCPGLLINLMAVLDKSLDKLTGTKCLSSGLVVYFVVYLNYRSAYNPQSGTRFFWTRPHTKRMKSQSLLKNDSKLRDADKPGSTVLVSRLSNGIGSTY